MKRMNAFAITVAAVLMATAAHADRVPREESQAARGQEIQAPRGDEIQAPRGQEFEARG
jgi:hypothetical protein